MYQLRKTELLRRYVDITASISKDLLRTKKEQTEQSDSFILTPELLLQSRLITEAPYLHQPSRGAFSTFAIVGELDEGDWAVYWMVVNDYFKCTLLYGNTLAARNIWPMFDIVLDRAMTYQAAGNYPAATAICRGILLGIERDLPLISWKIRRWFGGQPALLEEVQFKATAQLQALALQLPSNDPAGFFDCYLFRHGILLPWERKYKRVWKPLARR